MRVCAGTLESIAAYAGRGRVVVFDTETTGGTRNDEICQIAAAEYVCGELRRTMNAYLCPTCEMNFWAERIHGLSMDFLRLNGMEPTEALARFFDFLGSDAMLVAHNNRFDMGMLRQECAKFGVVFEPVNVETCDTLALSRFLHPEFRHHSLGSLLEPLGVEGVNSHDALDDTLACAGVFFKLVAEIGVRTAKRGAPQMEI